MANVTVTTYMLVIKLAFAMNRSALDRQMKIFIFLLDNEHGYLELSPIQFY